MRLMGDTMSIFRLRNFKCNKCKTEAVLLVIYRPACPKCESDDIEYDENS